MDPARVAASEIAVDGASFHFVVVEPAAGAGPDHGGPQDPAPAGEQEPA
jgi:hypothetical protein